MVLMGKPLQGFTRFGIALISEFAVAIDGMETAPAQLVADRGLTGARNTFYQIVSDTHFGSCQKGSSTLVCPTAAQRLFRGQVLTSAYLKSGNPMTGVTRHARAASVQD